MENEKKNLHFKYVIGILIAIIILLTSFKLGVNEKLIDYVNFALILTSLVLAIIAIVHAIYSNSSFTQQVSLINEISNDVKKQLKV